MKTLAELLTAAAAEINAARAINNEINSLMFAPVGTPAQEAATNAQIQALKKQLSAR